MPRASSRTLPTVVTARRNVKRRGKLGRTISSRTLLATTSLLSEAYGLSPCSCNDDALEIENSGQASLLSRSSNAFWHRKSKSSGKKQQRNNSTASESQTTSSKTFRQSFVERWKRNKKKSPTMITARTILRKRTNTKTIAQKQNSIHPLTTTEISVDPPSLTQGDTLHSSLELDRLASQDNSNADDDDDANPTLEPTTASCLSEQQNINATSNTHRSTYETSQSTIHDHNSSRKTKSITSRTNHSKTTRPMLSRSTMHSSKRKKPKRITKRNTKKKRTSTSKRNNSRRFLSKNRRKIFPYSPFPDPNLFHSIPPMKDSDEITRDNIRTNHLCCKPITSVKGLSTNDQKKLIEHDYLTLISLLPMYLGSQGHFQQKIREKTEISADGASELDHLMNEWGSARLFIGMHNPYKTLTQKI